MAFFVLTSRGSQCDVNPFLGLGAALKARGHDVTLILNEHFRRHASALGLSCR
jgi:UDP:flavonoid glycosyltransferase YjiC (YdhE family)